MDIPLRSSHLHSAHYDATTNVLTVRFKKGGIYQYFDVAQPAVNLLAKTKFPGRTFNLLIKPFHKFKKLA